MNTVRIRALNPAPITAICSGWEHWYEVTYQVNPVGSERMYSIGTFKQLSPELCKGHFGRAEVQRHSPPTLQQFIDKNRHLLDAEISRRVMKRDHQRPDEIPEKKRAPIKKRVNQGHGTAEIPDL